MANLLNDIVEFICQKDSAFTAGENIWYDSMFDDPDFAVTVYELEGQSIVPQVAGASRKITVVVRAATPTLAMSTAKELFNHLSTEDGYVQVTNDRWAQVTLLHTPHKLKVDEKSRVYYSFSAIFTTYID